MLRIQTSTAEASERKALLSLLSAEFSDQIRILSDTSRMEIRLQSGVSRSVLIALVQPLATEKAALSGLMKRDESKNLLHLARKLRMFNFKSEYLMGLIQSRAPEQMLIHAIDNIEQSHMGAIDGIRHVATQLGLTLQEVDAD